MSQTTERISEPESSQVSCLNVEQLFEHSRVQEWPNIYKLLLYIPVGIFLLLLRLTAGVVGLLFLSLLPPSSRTRSTVLKGICKILGIIVEVDDKHIDENAKVLVANHVSILDHIAVNTMIPCNFISSIFEGRINDFSLFWKNADSISSRDLTFNEMMALNISIDESTVPVLTFPEGATTNGKMGLLKFHPAVFSLNFLIQPISIHVSMSSFMEVSPTVLGSVVWKDILWTFFLPCTFFKLKAMPSMTRLPEESALEFSKRVQETMASSMSLKPTVFTTSEKFELRKRLQTSSRGCNVTVGSSVTYTKSVSTEHHLQTCSKEKPTLNTAAETFGKSPKERMQSYQERRTFLLEAARRKYLEKQTVSNMDVCS